MNQLSLIQPLPAGVTNDRTAPLVQPRPNALASSTSVAKLNGQVYTPDVLAAQIVASIPMRDEARWLDPSCGDGVFLEAALTRAAQEGRRIHLEGWDVDASAIEAARLRINACLRRLDVEQEVTLAHRDALCASHHRFDVVVGNPPYLESKRMPDELKAHIRSVCPKAGSGAFDLYGAFIERALSLLTKSGTLAFIVPNRLLVASWADPLRRWLLSTGRLSAVDLSRSKVFGDEAAVYPIVFRVDLGLQNEWCVLEADGQLTFSLDSPWLLERLDGLLPLPRPGIPGRMLQRVLETRLPSIDDHIDVRWAVSFHRAGLRDQYTFENSCGSFAKPFLGGGRFSGNREVEPYSIKWAGWWIDYDEERARRDGNPFPPAELFVEPKVIIPQNVRRPRAAMDCEGYILKDTLLLARVKDHTVANHWLPWLVHVINSDVFFVLYEQLYGGTRKGGDFIHLLGRYLRTFPLPAPPDFTASVHLHDSILETGVGRREAEELVRSAYQVTDEEAAWIDAQTLHPT